MRLAVLLGSIPRGTQTPTPNGFNGCLESWETATTARRASVQRFASQHLMAAFLQQWRDTAKVRLLSAPGERKGSDTTPCLRSKTVDSPLLK